MEENLMMVSPLTWVTLGLLVLLCGLALAILILLIRQKRFLQDAPSYDELQSVAEKTMNAAVERTGERVAASEKLIIHSQRQLRDATDSGMNLLQESLSRRISEMTQSNARSFSQLQTGMTGQLHLMSDAITGLQANSQEQISELRSSVTAGMENIRRENAEQLTQMRRTVDEQLQETLDRKLKQSFDSVVEQLGQVQKGLGEMTTLAGSVGDLKRVLSNTKTRGILGEIQLGAILEQILPREQYAVNICTVKGSTNPVEYAICLPGDGTPVYLPIDSKFPLETYTHLLDAYDSADPQQIDSAKKALEQRLLSEAKDVHDKYIHVPETTEFGIIFLPAEGLYAEAVRIGMIEKLQNRFHIMLAGPTTMAAMLNSLQMGFRTLAIQQRSSEVWKILENVKAEFGKFNETLLNTQKRITQANDELEQLVGVRSRKISSSLSRITAFPEENREDEGSVKE